AGEVFGEDPATRRSGHKAGAVPARTPGWGTLGMGAAIGALVGALVVAAMAWFWWQRGTGLAPTATSAQPATQVLAQPALQAPALPASPASGDATTAAAAVSEAPAASAVTDVPAGW